MDKENGQVRALKPTAFSAIKNNDKVGLLAFTDKVEKFIPPRKGVGHVLRVIRDALYFVKGLKYAKELTA